MDKHLHNSCKITCGKERGSGFLISPTQLISAAHVFPSEPGVPITVEISRESGFIAQPAQVTLLEGSPIAILTLSEATDYIPTTFLKKEPEPDDVAIAYGYPAALDKSYRAKFSLNHTLVDRGKDAPEANVLLDIENRLYDLQGMSGAAIIIDGEIAGILLKEVITEGAAHTAYALAGPEFRDKLSAFGVEITVGDTYLAIDQGNSQMVFKMQDETRKCRSELNQHLNSELNQLIEMRLNGQYKTAWNRLTKVLPAISGSMASNKEKSAYFHLAAIWSIEDKNGQEDKYIGQAIEIDPDIDTRIFCSNKALQSNNTEESLSILEPVDCVEILNQRIKTLYVAGRIAEAIEEPKKHICLVLNELSHELLALCHLENRDHQQALSHVEEALQEYPHSVDMLCIKACIYWERALSELGATVRYNYCVIVSPLFYMPDREQQKDLQQAIDCLTVALEYAEHRESREWIESALTSISAVYPDKDEMLWLLRLEREFPESSIPIFFRVLLKKSISDEQVEAFLSARGVQKPGYYQAKYMLLMEKGRFQEAQECLKEHSDSIERAFMSSLVEQEFMIAQHQNDWVRAEELIDQMEDPIPKERMRLTLDINSQKITKKNISKRVIAFAKETGLPVDYHRAYQYFSSVDDWQHAAQIAKAWYKVAPSIAVDIRCAESLLNYGREQKAMQHIERIEAAGYSSKLLLRLKARCLYSASKLEEVQSLLDSLQFEESDYELVLQKADSFIICGDTESAIQCLREYADHGFKNKEVMRRLVSLLRAVDLDSACFYAIKEHEMFPGDIIALRDCILLCANTGRMPPASWEELKPIDGVESPYLKICDYGEVTRVLEETRKRTGEIIWDYYQMKMPFCAFEDSLVNGNMGINLYMQWHRRAIGSALAIYANGGGGVCPEFGERLVLDYTAIVSAIELDILEQVCDSWNCFISPRLMPLIISEITNSKDSQKHIEEEKERLLNEMESASIQFVGGHFDLEEPTLYHYHAAIAQTNHYLLVAEEPPSDFGIKMPDGWEQYTISPEAFYSYLREKGLCPASVSVQETIDNTDGLSQYWSGGFLLDRESLLWLSKNHILPLVADSISIAVSDLQYEQLKEEVQKYQVKQEVAEWLPIVMEKTSDLIRRKKLKILENKKYYDEEERVPRITLLVHELELQRQNHCFFWCDDRFMSRYCSPSIVGMLNILVALYKNDKAGLYLKLDILFDRHIGNILPSVDYLISRLQLCRLNSEKEILCESTALKNIRATICGTIESNIPCLSDSVTQPEEVPERTIYIGNLRFLIIKALEQIWKSKNDLQWKRAAASWVMNAFYVPQHDAEKDDISRIKPSDMQADLIIMGFAQLIKECQQYYRWLLGYLEPAWNSTPEDERRTAIRLVESLGSLKIEEEIVLAINILCKFFPYTSFMHEFFSVLDSYSIISEDFDYNTAFPKRATTRIITDELDCALLKNALEGDIVTQETLLNGIYENPECCERVVSYYETAQNESPVGDQHFLATLFWYAPADIKARVRRLYLLAVCKESSI